MISESPPPYYRIKQLASENLKTLQGFQRYGAADSDDEYEIIPLVDRNEISRSCYNSISPIPPDKHRENSCCFSRLLFFCFQQSER